MGVNALKILRGPSSPFVVPFPSVLSWLCSSYCRGSNIIDGPMQVKYWGVRTPAALMSMYPEHLWRITTEKQPLELFYSAAFQDTATHNSTNQSGITDGLEVKTSEEYYNNIS